MDEFRDGLGDAWQVATWANGPPFGGAFSREQVGHEKGLLSLGFDGAAGTAAEVRTRQFWQYGRFTVEMRPAPVAGSVSSFFLYTGVAAAASHHEIDIEFLGSRPMLHTNVWVGGQPSPKDIDLRRLGIDPFARSRLYAFEWQPDSITWRVMGDDGNWLDVRREEIRLGVPMQLMMNAWYGDNQGDALAFPGYYRGEAGKTEYRMVRIDE